MRTYKRLLAVLLSAVMLCGMLPFSIFAVDEEPSSGTESGTAAETYTVNIIVYSGSSPDDGELKFLSFKEEIPVGETYEFHPDAKNCVCWTYKKNNVKRWDSETEGYVNAKDEIVNDVITVSGAATYAVRYVNTPEHLSNIETVPAVDPKCYKDGNTGGLHCKECGWTTAEVIPANGKHDWVEIEERAASCEAEGYTAGWYCANEGCEYNDDEHPKYTVIKALPHTYDDCTNYTILGNGDITYHCSGCDKDVVSDLAWFKGKGGNYDGVGYTYGGVRNAWVKLDAYCYYFDNNGHILLGTEKYGDYEFSILGRLYNGSVECDGDIYMYKDGILVKNTAEPVRIGMRLYDFAKNGKGTLTSKNAGLVTSGEEKFYLCEDGKLLRSGWKQIDGELYYFGKDCVMATGECVISGVTYTFDADGKCRTESGLASKASGKKAYVKDNGELARSEWVQIGDAWYYFNRDNDMVTGDFVIEGISYEFGADGVCQNYVG